MCAIIAHFTNFVKAAALTKDLLYAKIAASYLKGDIS